MISTNFLQGQGLGNQLWVYAACRGIASHFGLPFSIGGKEYFKGDGFLSIDWGEGYVDSLNVFRERLYHDTELNYFASSYDRRVEAITANTRLEGLFQSEEYFYGKISGLRDWIRLSDDLRERARQYNHLCVLNIRGGEYKRHRNLILPRSYWIDGMNNIRQATGVDRFLIVTDDQAYCRSLLPDVPLLNGDIKDCYAALYGAHCHVVSNSSFAYFPIKTRADDTYVIAPYLWSRFGNVFQRWAAPANFYHGWLWQDTKGRLHTCADCQSIRNQTDQFYRSEYNVCTAATGSSGGGVLSGVTVWIKRLIKRMLSKAFPRYIG